MIKLMFLYVAYCVTQYTPKEILKRRKVNKRRRKPLRDYPAPNKFSLLNLFTSKKINFKSLYKAEKKKQNQQVFPKKIDKNTDFNTVIQMRRLKLISKTELIDYLTDNNVLVSYDKTFCSECSIYNLDGWIIGDSYGFDLSKKTPEELLEWEKRIRRRVLLRKFGRKKQPTEEELNKKEVELYNSIYSIPDDNEIKELTKKANQCNAISMLKLERYYLLSLLHSNVKKGMLYAKFIPMCQKYSKQKKDFLTAVLLSSYAKYSIKEYFLHTGDKTQFRTAKRFFLDSSNRVFCFGRLMWVQIFIKECAGKKNIDSKKLKEIELELLDLSSLGFCHADSLLKEFYSLTKCDSK